jgi:predicted transcriptional regulator
MENMADDMKEWHEWMKPIDDKILETLRDEPYRSTPAAVADAIGSSSPDYVGERIRTLVDKGFARRVHHGTYRISEDGKKWLTGESDTSDESAGNTD